MTSTSARIADQNILPQIGAAILKGSAPPREKFPVGVVLLAAS